MPYSFVSYTGNGVTTQFAVPFGYIRREHVFVNVSQVSTAFTWVNNSTVQLAAAPANGALVDVRRATPASTPLVDFVDGSTPVAADFDVSNLQHLYLEQELLDNQVQTVSTDPATGLPTLSNQRLTNVADPINAQDASTKSYTDTKAAAAAAEALVDDVFGANGITVTDNSPSSGQITVGLSDGGVNTSKLADADLQTLANCQTGAATAFSLLTAAEVARLDGLTASTSELNQLTGKSITGSLNPANANDIPTSTAINSWVSNLVNALGGFVAIPNRTSFPTSNPDPSDDAGTVVSIADAGGLVVSAGGVATNAQTTGAVAVTITGFPAVYQSTTLVAGLGIQVQTTSTLNTYTFHKSIPTDADIVQLNEDVNNFFARYRYGPANPTTDLDAGDLFFNTTLGKMLVYNGITAAWEEVQSLGSFSINTLSSSGGVGGGSATFNGTAYRFTLSNPPTFAQQLIVSINGVVQKPNSGTAQPAEGFAIDQNDIIFSNAPAAGADFFIITLGTSVDIGAPSDGTVTTAKLANSAVTEAKVGLTQLLNYVYLTTAGSGTYTPTAGTKRILVEVWGAGGGGGGVDGVATAGFWAKGGSGGGGGYCSKWIASGLAASYSYTVGARGAGGTAGANNGSQGGASSFSGTGVSLTANGGLGGAGQTAVSGGNSSSGSFGGVATGGDINIKGGVAESGLNVQVAIRTAIVGVGYSFPASETTAAVSSSSGSAGSDGVNPSEGGTGGVVRDIATNYAGGDGGPGLIKITEYFV